MKHPLLDRWVRVLMSINPKGKVPNINTATRQNMSVTTLEKMKMVDQQIALRIKKYHSIHR